MLYAVRALHVLLSLDYCVEVVASKAAYQV
jgi:4-hydroxy-3-polyprenylbenzoate decarboxylase